MTRRRILDYALAVAMLTVALFLFRSNANKPGQLNSFDQAVLRVSSPLQAVLSWGVEGIGSMWSRYVDLAGVEKDNIKLRDKNRELREQLAAATRRARDMKMLEQLVELRQRRAADTIGARVIAASINPHFRVLRIRVDRGEGEVKRGMPVINADGLVGRIDKVFGAYSDVLLTTDAKSSVEVYIPRTGGMGFLRGLGRDDSYTCELGRLNQSDEVKPGDLILTSGRGRLPRNIPVGRVKRVASAEAELFLRVEVAPVVKFANLGPVLIELAPPPPPDPRAGKRKRAPQAAYGVRAF